MRFIPILVLILIIGLVWGLLPVISDTAKFDLSRYMKESEQGADMADTTSDRLKEAVVGGGCFWCVEAVYERITGVTNVVSGYAGGQTVNPTYHEVSSGRTGHAEVVRITYDPNVITYREILEIFFKSHDPTTLNRQGADRGTQYRSIVLYETDEERRIAEEVISQSQALWDDRIVTEITRLETFYEAEDYHQDYFENNQYAGYCQVVIAPKLKKLGLDSASTFE